MGGRERNGLGDLKQKKEKGTGGGGGREGGGGGAEKKQQQTKQNREAHGTFPRRSGNFRVKYCLLLRPPINEERITTLPLRYRFNNTHTRANLGSCDNEAVQTRLSLHQRHLDLTPLHVKD